MDEKIKKAILFLGIIAIFFLTSANSVLAFELEYPDIFGLSINNSSSFPEYARYFFNLGIALAAFMAVIAVAFGGVYFLVDFARGKIASEGKEWVKSGSLGLIIVLCAYLIAYTINPTLVVFDLRGLAPLNFIANLFNPPGPSLPVDVYKEIPIGTLTENLLSQTMDCYEFDDNGDPTYLSKSSRADCVLKLGQAAEKKSLIVKNLSDEIVKLMDQCNCSKGADCNTNCQKCPDYAGVCPLFDDEGYPIDSSTDPSLCPDNCSAGCSGQNDCCPEGIKNKIEHGPIKISGEGNNGQQPAKKTITFYTTYAHMDKIYVSVGQNVNEGTIITIIGEAGKVGATGAGAYPHIHFAVGLTDPAGIDSISFNIYPSVSAPGGAIGQRASGVPGPVPTPDTYTQSDLDDILDSLIPPVFPNYCNWTEVLGSLLHSGYAYWAQDWRCPSNIMTDKAQIIAMAGGSNIKSTVAVVNPLAGNVVIKHNITITSVSTPEECVNPEKEYDGLDEFRSRYDYNQIKNIPWQDLRLIEQLIFLQGKIEEMKSKIEQDFNQLKSAESLLGQCYIADTYIDFLKTYEQTNKKDKIILIEKPFAVSPAKYCQGFQYNNSDCYNQCQKACPEAVDDIRCFGNCPICASNDNNCLKRQNDCIKICQGEQKCIFNNSFADFQGCMSYCKQDCLDSCDKACSVDDKNKCQEKCNNDSKCLLDNENTCLISVEGLKNCAEKFGNDNEGLQNCADNTALCKYCSDQYAGYPECLKPPYSLQNKYSSSFIYQHPAYQVCPDPYKTNNGVSCLTSYPETAKCPSSSSCPKCPCGIIDTKYRICSADCQDFSYNDDPLTFYCQQTWWLKKDEVKNTKPIGGEKICPKEGEIPIGKTIDDAEKWAQDFLDSIDKVTEKIQNMIEYMKKIGEEKDYCQCGSKCDSEGKELVCQAKCIFNYSQIESTDPNSGETIITDVCTCDRGGCQGNPCQKIINMLKGKKADDSCPEGTEYKGIKYYYEQISKAIKDFATSIVQQDRSDILKELIYSRKKTDECSVVQNNYLLGETRILSCTRVEHEILSPIIDKNSKTIIDNRAISSYCYGKELGKILKTPEPLADNWFCCEDRTQK